MVIEFAEILHDLELKRAAALQPSERPVMDVAAAVGDAAAVDVAVRDDDGIAAPYAPALTGALVADALSTLAAAAGEAEADTAAGRAIVRATARRVGERLAGLGGATITTADLSALVEAALIEAGHYDVAKALVVQRVPPLGPRCGDAAADPPQRRRRPVERVEDRGGRPQGVPLAPGRPRARGGDRRARRRARAVTRRRLRADRGRPGHRPGGARARRPHARGRALHRLPRRASHAASAGAPARRRAGDPGARGRRQRVRVDRRRPARRIAFASIGLDLGLDAAQLERELRRVDPTRRGARRPAPPRGAQRQGAGRARQRLLAVRRPHPAHLRLRGGARLGRRARRHRRAARRAPPRAAANARARRRDRADRPAAARLRPRRGSPPRSTRRPTSTSTSSASRRSTTAT